MLLCKNIKEICESSWCWWWRWQCQRKCWWLWWLLRVFFNCLRRVVKMDIYGQADRKGGGGGSATSALTVSKCENFDPFFPLKFDSLILKTYIKQMWKFWPIFFIEIWFFDTQNTFYLIGKCLKKFACPFCGFLE